MRARIAFATLLALLVPVGLAGAAQAAAVTVTNGTQFSDTAGNPVQAHGAGVIQVGSDYYWFGENRNSDGTFKYVSVYKSSDLKTWTYDNNVLTQSSASELAVANIERPKVIYNSSTGQYVMWMHWENGSDYTEARVAVAVSSTVDGNYTYQGSFRPLGNTSRDMTVFRDDDGTAYLISATNANADLDVYQLTSDYLGVDHLVQTLWAGSYREAPAMFKRNGVYFLMTSAATGWLPNQQEYATATSVAGTWSSLATVGDGTGYASQTAYVLPVAGTSTTTYLYLGDRWAGAWGGAVDDSNYVWLPLTFPSTTSVSMSYAGQVSIDTATGAVSGTTSGYNSLIARHSGKCADVTGGSTANSAAVIQYTCSGATNQQWRLQNLNNGYYQIVARHSEKCMDVTGASTTAGTAVIQYTCGSGTNQQWQLNSLGSGYYSIVSRNSGMCLDVTSASTADHAAVIQYTCSGATNQQWSLPAV
ncbi:MAG TPA: RICIN domain-containing protein [Rugosimonospora sp.]|nr:RICIN domain-containing protein [Rugosimonospora sp.]